MQVPEYVLAEIEPGLAIQWAGRRAFYELIEELSDAIWWTWIIASATYGMVLLFDQPRLWFGLLFIIWPARYLFFEVKRWQHEIYVVARNDARGGGKTYKFWGWPSQLHIEDPITDKGPTIMPNKNWRYRIWGKLTGEHMEKVAIYGDNNKVYIEGRRISPMFERSMKIVRGAEPISKAQELPGKLPLLREINMLRAAGILDKKKATGYVEQIIHSELWGE